MHDCTQRLGHRLVLMEQLYHATALLDSLTEMAWFRARSGIYVAANSALESLSLPEGTEIYGLMQASRFLPFSQPDSRQPSNLR